MTVLYDGACPFCASYVALLRLQAAVGPVDLVDARSADPRVAAALAAGLDLDEGMVVRWDGRTFHGADAARLLALLSSEGGLFRRLQRWLFATPGRAARVYAALAWGRRAYLRMTGRPLIRPASKKSGPRE